MSIAHVRYHLKTVQLVISHFHKPHKKLLCCLVYTPVRSIIIFHRISIVLSCQKIFNTFCANCHDYRNPDYVMQYCLAFRTVPIQLSPIFRIRVYSFCLKFLCSLRQKICSLTLFQLKTVPLYEAKTVSAFDCVFQ